MAHGMYAYLIVIDGIGCITITYKPVLSITLVNNMDQHVNSLLINSIFNILQLLIVSRSYSHNIC